MARKLEGPSGDTMGGQVANLGRFVSAQLGVGTCRLRLYNKSESSWGVGMVYAGLCHLEGQPAGNDVGYPQYGNLNHPADGESTYTNLRIRRIAD